VATSKSLGVLPAAGRAPRRPQVALESRLCQRFAGFQRAVVDLVAADAVCASSGSLRLSRRRRAFAAKYFIDDATNHGGEGGEKQIKARLYRLDLTRLPPQRRCPGAVQASSEAGSATFWLGRAQLPAPRRHTGKQAVAMQPPSWVVQRQHHAAPGVASLRAQASSRAWCAGRDGQRLVEQRDARRLHRKLRQPRALALARERASGRSARSASSQVARCGARSGGAEGPALSSVEGVMAERDEIGHAAEKTRLRRPAQQANVLRAGERGRSTTGWRREVPVL